ncbi:hypothetical protein BJX61DRAFT_547292 [Aspergillus egyptiacus]|nr:hypothetical protein BJX61DRAFT_547292 [Aspergillus egyptiacus]
MSDPSVTKSKPVVLSTNNIHALPIESFEDPTRGEATWRTLFTHPQTPTSNLSAGIAMCQPRSGYLCSHYHAEAEIYYILEGRGVVTIDGVPYHVEKGSAVFIPGNMEHSVANYDRAELKWLEDRHAASHHPLVALKIPTAESANRNQELEILSRRSKAGSILPGKAIVQRPLHAFTVTGPNGTHQCLVTDAARLNRNEVKDYPYHRLLHLPAARAIVVQLVLGLQFIHSQGVVHGELVIPIWLGNDSDKVTLADARIMIVDFGEAFDPRRTKQSTAHTPLLLALPESRFDDADPLSFPAGVWTLACTIWDIFGCRPPFESFPASLDEVTVEQVEMLGKLPDRWWNQWEERSNWFDEDGHKNVKEDLRQWYGNTPRDWNMRFIDYIPTTSRAARV